VIYLSKQHKRISISPDGTKVFVEGSGKKQEFRAFTDGAILPSKLQQWYAYASDFINVLRRKTPKIVAKTKSPIEIDGLQFTLSSQAIEMVSGETEVTVKFKPKGSAPSIEMNIQSIRGPRCELLEIDENVNGIKKSYEVDPE
jgi:hypothetical protein